MPRLIHLNGPPAIGKSTLARRYADDHPGVLCWDVDVVRTLVGGWSHDYAGAGALVRPLALAGIRAWLDEGRDVVLPQLLADPVEHARFRAAATDVGADPVHVLLTDEVEAAVERFHLRTAWGVDPHAGVAARAVDDAGGDELLRDYHQRLTALAGSTPTTMLHSRAGDVEGTYAALRDVLG